MKKKILAVIGAMTITIAMIIVGCSSKDVKADAQANTEPAGQAVSVSDTTKSTVQSEVASGNTTAETAAASAATEKNSSTTAKKAVQTTAKTTAKQTAKSSTAKQTTKAAAKTTAKTTTTKPAAKATTRATTKATTKKQTTTVKNVSAKDVQAQVNAYIRSKGITVDNSLNSGNSGWSGEISGTQERLNNGRTLQLCKEYVDMEIASMGTNISLYCYYSNETFYICYM